MPRKNALTQKTKRLKQDGCLNPHPDRVKDPIFVGSDFFDPHDLVQIKYEMVRRVQSEAQSVTHSAQAFGFSRPAFYQAQALVKQGGLSALVRKKPGPQRAHKLDATVVAFLNQVQRDDPTVHASDLAAQVHTRFGITVHPRSIERALAKQKKTPVTVQYAVPHDGDTLLTAYEALRAQALAKTPSAQRFGLTVLLRYGMRAWINGQTQASKSVTRITSREKPFASTPLDPGLKACLVQVLANMMFTEQGEFAR